MSAFLLGFSVRQYIFSYTYLGGINMPTTFPEFCGKGRLRVHSLVSQLQLNSIFSPSVWYLAVLCASCLQVCQKQDSHQKVLRVSGNWGCGANCSLCGFSNIFPDTFKLFPVIPTSELFRGCQGPNALVNPSSRLYFLHCSKLFFCLLQSSNTVAWDSRFILNFFKRYSNLFVFIYLLLFCFPGF